MCSSDLVRSGATEQEARIALSVTGTPMPDSAMTPEGRIALERIYTSEQLDVYEKLPAWFFQTWKTSGLLVSWDARLALATFERGMLS